MGAVGGGGRSAARPRVRRPIRSDSQNDDLAAGSWLSQFDPFAIARLQWPPGNKPSALRATRSVGTAGEVGGDGQAAVLNVGCARRVAIGVSYSARALRLFGDECERSGPLPAFMMGPSPTDRRSMDKRMEIRRDDRCAMCGTKLLAGTTAHWIRTERVVRCVPCHTIEVGGPTAASEPPSSNGATDAPVRPVWPDESHPSLVVVSPRDEAGQSALKEYEKRSARELAKKERCVA